MENDELMPIKDAIELRIKQNILPTIDIAGEIFHVALSSDMLWPESDFLSKGIVFSDIEGYFDIERNIYMIPYDPKEHEYREIDYNTITEIPKDLIVVSIPNEIELDRLGWNSIHGYDLNHGLAPQGVKMHFKATLGTWEETGVPQKIRENLEKIKNKKLQPKTVFPLKKPKQKKGRGM